MIIINLTCDINCKFAAKHITNEFSFAFSLYKKGDHLKTKEKGKNPSAHCSLQQKLDEAAGKSDQYRSEMSRYFPLDSI